MRDGQLIPLKLLVREADSIRLISGALFYFLAQKNLFMNCCSFILTLYVYMNYELQFAFLLLAKTLCIYNASFPCMR